MGFSTFVTDRYMKAGGILVEEGQYVMDTGTASGTITPATSGNGINGRINEITEDSFGTRFPGSFIGRVYSTGRKTVTIRSTLANENGSYRISGPMV